MRFRWFMSAVIWMCWIVSLLEKTDWGCYPEWSLRARNETRRGLQLGLTAAFAGALSIACGPVQSTTLIVDASAELSAAKTARADKHAPFEFTAAEEYLHKAREEQSYADFQVAVNFARKSLNCARVARMLAEAATRKAMGSSRPTMKTRRRCRPGPKRMVPIPDANEEPNLDGAKVRKPKKTKKTKTGSKAGKKTSEPKKGRKPIKPKGEPEDPPEPTEPPQSPEVPLPEGDAGEGS